MKTIFTKFNNDRLPKYQTVTKIVVDNNKKRYALKEPLCKNANEHIENMYHNYNLLMSTYNVNLVKPTKIENGMLFEMAEGTSLENILLESISKNDDKNFRKYINKYLNFIDSMVSIREQKFIASKEFENIFGMWEIDKPQDILRIGNIDLIFGNIFVDESDEFTIIDYEWVFNFEVPKDYIIWRSLGIFANYHSIEINNVTNLYKDYNEFFLMLDQNFTNFVHGKDKKYFLSPNVTNQLHFLNLEKKENIILSNYYIKLFIENENGITEENSIKFDLLENNDIQKFVFDLSNKDNIKTLRLDPLSDSCVIEIEKVYLILDNDMEIDLTNNMSSNACSNYEKRHFFESPDPQIYFINIDLSIISISKFIIELKYEHISKKSVHVCANQILNDKNNIINIQEQNIQNLNIELEQKEQNIQNLNKKASSLESELISILSSKSWKITKPIRKVVQKIKNEDKVIEKSGLFDKDYYLNSNEDVKINNIDPIKHYLEYGWKENRNPSNKFDTEYYLNTYDDVRKAKINPLIHYIKKGKKEKRNPLPVSVSVFDSKFQKIIKLIKYAKNNPHLIKRSFYEIKLNGFKKAILKLKNKYNKIESSIVSKENFKNFDELKYILNDKIVIPKFITNKPIDIIIPIYNGFEFLEPLINSIIKNTSMDYRILMCDDKSSDEKVLPFLKKIKELNTSIDITLLENEQNLGFIKTVNKLVKYTNNHFVLLNTDTEVPPYWMERLMYPIFEMKNISSTTPFTNAGTICSFPNYLEDNLIFEGMDVEELDKYFQYINFEKTFIEIPTGVGFCMGVNKELVDKIGMFDEVFGKGYGEENDWCQRAIKEGYKNLHVTNLFVYHKHGGSFSSEEKQRLISMNLATLNQKHSTYDDQVHKLIQKNELIYIRELVQIKIKSKKLFTTLIIDHGLGGGANEYTYENIEKRIKLSQMIILIKYDFNVLNNYTIEFIADNMIFKFSTLNIEDTFKYISTFKINEIFLNSLVSYPNISETIDKIVKVKETTESKIVLPIHDYFMICPSYTLLDKKMNYCGVPNDLNICMNCLKNNNNEFKIFEKETDIKKWRESWKSMIDVSDEIICFSNSSKEIFLKAYKNNESKITILPHDISGRYSEIYDSSKKYEKITIGVLGGINEPKGANIIKDLVEHIDKNNINAKIILIGQISVPINSKSFEVTGKYDKKDLPEIVKKLNINKFLIPSIWPETFSYTTDEIMQLGYPLIVFDLGAPAERVKNYKFGKVINIEDIKEVIFEN